MMQGGQFARRMEALVDEIHQVPLADGTERLFVPGEMEWERHARVMKEGMLLAPDVVGSLKEAGRMVGLDFEKAAGLEDL